MRNLIAAVLAGSLALLAAHPVAAQTLDHDGYAQPIGATSAAAHRARIVQALRVACREGDAPSCRRLHAADARVARRTEDALYADGYGDEGYDYDSDYGRRGSYSAGYQNPYPGATPGGYAPTGYGSATGYGYAPPAGYGYAQPSGYGYGGYGATGGYGGYGYGATNGSYPQTTVIIANSDRGYGRSSGYTNSNYASSNYASGSGYSGYNGYSSGNRTNQTGYTGGQTGYTSGSTGGYTGTGGWHGRGTGGGTQSATTQSYQGGGYRGGGGDHGHWHR